MSERIVDKALKIIKPIVEDLGYIFVDLEYKKEFSGNVLALTIDSPEGITINDCEKVSKALDEPLDQLNPTNDVPYSLNVSSLGLDRPLTTEYEFNKYKGKEVEIKFYQPLQPFNKKQLSAVLDSWNDSEIIVTIDNQNITISRKSIAQIVPVIKF